jgi:rod shape-determining protein MreD
VRAFVEFLLALFAATLLHFIGARIWPSLPQAVDFYLVVLVRQALSGGTLSGLLAGVVVGVAQDSLSGRLYGFYGCADTAVGYLTAMVAQRVVIQRATGVMLAFLAASITQQAILLLLTLLLLPASGGLSIPWIVSRALTAALLGGLWHVSSAGFFRRYDSWRRNRGSRLQFGR